MHENSRKISIHINQESGCNYLFYVVFVFAKKFLSWVFIVVVFLTLIVWCAINTISHILCPHRPSLHTPTCSHEKLDYEGRKTIERDQFRLVHYAGDVTYSVTAFVDKNNDLLYRSLKEVSGLLLLPHSITHSLTHSPTHSLTHSLTHSYTHPFTHSHMYTSHVITSTTVHVHWCAVLLCLVVCLTLLASFFLRFHLSLKHVHVLCRLPVPARTLC